MKGRTIVVSIPMTIANALGTPALVNVIYEVKKHPYAAVSTFTRCTILGGKAASSLALQDSMVT